MSELRDAACTYASWGWKVHPLWPRSKAPATKNGKNDATCDLGQVFRWWQTDYNIGINCRVSGLVVIDVDPRNGGDHALIDGGWLNTFPITMTSGTGGGGAHYYFRHPGVPLKGQLAPGIDIKDCGYVIAPPSTHPSGMAYEWWSEDGTPVADLPPEMLNKMSRESHVSAPLTPSDAPLLQIPSREYFTTLTGLESAHWVRCPWHDDDTPSMKLEGPWWTCFVCEPLPGKQVCGGNIVSFAGKLWDFPFPLEKPSVAEIMDRLNACFEPC